MLVWCACPGVACISGARLFPSEQLLLPPVLLCCRWVLFAGITAALTMALLPLPAAVRLDVKMAC